ncbi:MAG TPA: HAMP domain-containing sensor histidine kinase [Steroidobacteraceae bacterium]
MPRGNPRSISLLIVISTITVLLTVALLVGWTFVIVQNMAATRAVSGSVWLLAGGISFFVVILTVVVLFSVFLVREILEVRRQQTFIDSVTHELKSPLASLKLCLDTLARPELSQSQREHLRRMMLADVERLTIFVDDILEASRISHGLRAQQWTTVNVTQLVQRCIEVMQRRYELDDAAITANVPEGLTIHTDPTALETVLKNLLDNAIKYSTPPPRVTVEVRAEDAKHIRLEVIDQGIGIERSQLKRIFRRFYRVPSDDVYARRGTGLGLYVVAALVRNLGGRIVAHSEGYMRGTRMSVKLPVAVATSEVA